MKHKYHIDYNNVTLRPLEKDDIEFLRNWRNYSSNTIYLRKIPFITAEMQIEWFKRYLNNNDEICFAICENNVLKRIVGSLSLYEFHDDTCSFGRILIGDQEAHGKKVGLNATQAAIKIAFEQLNMKKVRLYVFSDNYAALKVYKQAGFLIQDEHTTDEGKQEYEMIIKRRSSDGT